MPLITEELDIVDMDGDIDIEVRNNCIYPSVVNDDDTRTAPPGWSPRRGSEAGRSWCVSSWLITAPVPPDPDIGYRAERRAAEKLVADAIEKVRATGR